MKNLDKISLLFLFLGIGFTLWEFSPKLSNSQILATTTNDEAPNFDYKVLSVHDGDTIKVKRGGQVLNVRFACIDAPELKQPGGVEARDYLKSLISRSGGVVGLNIISKDRYNRSVAEVWVNLPSEGFPQGSPNLVQSVLASAGMVYGYEQYKKDCPSWEAVQSSELYAKQNRLGVWKNSNSQKPWEWRRGKK